MSKVRNFVRFLLFILILSFITMGVYGILSWKDSRGIDVIYHSERDKIDALFVGSSHSFCSVNMAVLWKDYGIAADDIAENGQTFPTGYFFLKEALKKQKPKVVLVELYGLTLHIGIKNGNAYRNTLNMKWSPEYVDNLNCIMDILKTQHLNNNDTATDYTEKELYAINKEILLKFPVIHTRYSELAEKDFNQDIHFLRSSTNWSSEKFNIPKACKETEIGELSDSHKLYLEKYLDLSKEYGFRLVFWVAPYASLTKEHMKQYNAVEQFAINNSIGFYNFNKLIDETGFSYETDMRKEQYRGSHVNSYGSQKLSEYFGKELKEYYDLKDRRDDPDYSKYYDQMAREWRVECAVHELNSAKTIQDYAAAYDKSLFNATVILFNDHSSNEQDAGKNFELSASEDNLFQEPVNLATWYTIHPEYISYPDPATVMYSASGLTDAVKTRTEGAISLNTAEILGSNDYYVLSFEVMSPDWSAVREPTADNTGLNTIIMDFITSDNSPYGRQKAYKTVRLGNISLSAWLNIPSEKNGEWLSYVSVPLQFTSAKDTWSNVDKGIGQYLRIGPQFRGNGTVYIRNFSFEKCSQANDWTAAIKYYAKLFADQESNIKGIYTNCVRNNINGVWELSDQVRLVANEDDVQNTVLYNNNKEVTINKGDICIIITDKESGKFIKKNEFTLSNGKILKK